MNQDKIYSFISFFILFGNVSSKLNTEWWRDTTIYEIVAHAYKDSNGDGIGDLGGITSKLNHLFDLGIETVYITPFYKTGMFDMGYDIIDYISIDPMFGNMRDFEKLIAGMKARGMKLLLDLVINHTSDKHAWFLKSVEGIEPYTDYYVWKDPINFVNGTPQPPNDWQSWLDGSAWTWNEKRKQFYYHAFMRQQVDLNLRNENLKAELKSMMKFWLDKGIQGFRLDAPMYYLEDELLRAGGQRDQVESYEFIHELRNFLDKYNRKHKGFERIFAAEAHVPPNLAVPYYGTMNYPITHFPFNYYLEYNREELNAPDLQKMIYTWISNIPEGQTPAWVSQDHDHERTGTRIREEYMDIYTIITSMLPGVVHYYYGAEIGLLDGYIKRNQKRDVLGDGSRDPNRLIMPWDDTINGGFSRNLTTFLPSAVDYTRKNVKEQKNKEISHYHIMKRLIKLRAKKTLKEGKIFSHVYSNDLFIFWRSLMGYKTYVVITNLKDAEVEVNLQKIFINLPYSIFVETASINANLKRGSYLIGRKNFNLTMRPLSSIVLSTNVYLQQ